MDSHPKVRLDTIAEYKTLLTRVEQLSREKVMQHFPPSSEATDKDEAYRKKVEELVAEYVRRLFNLANTSITINGNDIGDVSSVLQAEADDQYEPYDDKLRVRVNELIAKVGTATTEVTKLRREVPGKASQAYAKKLAAEIDKEAALAEAALGGDVDTPVVDLDGGDRTMIDWGVKPLPRQVEVERSWEQAIDLLPALKKMDGPLTRAQGQVVKAQQILSCIEGTE